MTGEASGDLGLLERDRISGFGWLSRMYLGGLELVHHSAMEVSSTAAPFNNHRQPGSLVAVMSETPHV